MCQRRLTGISCNNRPQANCGLAVTRFLRVTVQRPDRRGPADSTAWGWHIKKARHDRGISYKRTAKVIGVSQGTLHEWEAGSRGPMAQSIPKIITFLGYVPTGRGPQQATLGASFRASRELRGLRIIDLSKLSGVPTKQISHIEHDRRAHYLPCAKIERALSIPVRYLFSRSQLRPRI